MGSRSNCFHPSTQNNPLTVPLDTSPHTLERQGDFLRESRLHAKLGCSEVLLGPLFRLHFWNMQDHLAFPLSALAAQLLLPLCWPWAGDHTVESSLVQPMYVSLAVTQRGQLKMRPRRNGLVRSEGLVAGRRECFPSFRILGNRWTSGLMGSR